MLREELQQSQSTVEQLRLEISVRNKCLLTSDVFIQGV